jgi:hypothetical protein
MGVFAASILRLDRPNDRPSSTPEQRRASLCVIQTYLPDPTQLLASNGKNSCPKTQWDAKIFNFGRQRSYT